MQRMGSRCAISRLLVSSRAVVAIRWRTSSSARRRSRAPPPGRCGDAGDAADDLALEAQRVEVPLAGHDEVGACDAVVQSDLVGSQVVMRDVEAGSTVVVSPARPVDQEGSPPPLES
jgi:hypothetical protein